MKVMILTILLLALVISTLGIGVELTMLMIGHPYYNKYVCAVLFGCVFCFAFNTANLLAKEKA